MGDMDNRICYYANKSFFDRDSQSYFVAKITENKAGYTQTSWAYSEPTKAQEEADRLNANLGWTRDDVLDIVASSMRASPMSKRPLIDVTISVFRDEATGEGVYDVLIIDRYTRWPSRSDRSTTCLAWTRLSSSPRALSRHSCRARRQTNERTIQVHGHGQRHGPGRVGHRLRHRPGQG